jgi:hypothetical protein
LIIQLKQTKLKKKLKNKSETSASLEKLSEYLRTNKLSEEDAIDRLRLQDFDPAKDFYATLVSASKQLMDSVKDKSLDLDDPYQKGLFQLLQAGDKINKSLKLAKLEAYPEEQKEDDDASFLDRIKSRQ